MAQSSLPIDRDRPGSGWFDAMPPWLDRPEHFESLGRRRVFAFLLDVCFMGMIGWALAFVLVMLSFVSFGLLSPLWAITGIVPLAYHTLTIGGRHGATWGMRLLDVEMRSWNGGRPDYIQAALTTIVFYVTMGFSALLVMLVALLNRRRRLLHDLLCGVVAVRASAVARTSGADA